MQHEVKPTNASMMKRRQTAIARGVGAMVAIELLKCGDVYRPDAALTKKVVAEAARRGLMLLSCGTFGNVIRILVPLTASDALLDEGLAILADSFATVA
jgi:4-aminobutyrate aminotransferase/(S)-3-amino-2-methylpropionate transaminase